MPKWSRETYASRPLEEALSLRHPDNLARWSDELKQLNIRVQAQLADRAGDRSPEAAEWRRKINAFQQSILQRRGECGRRLEELKAKRRAERSPRLDEAKYAATARLITAHRDEWLGYWREELISRGCSAAADELQ